MYREATCSILNLKTHHAVLAKAPFNMEDDMGRAYNTNGRNETRKEFW
jgi:hypothetical protein